MDYIVYLYWVQQKTEQAIYSEYTKTFPITVKYTSKYTSILTDHTLLIARTLYTNYIVLYLKI